MRGSSRDRSSRLAMRKPATERIVFAPRAPTLVRGLRTPVPRQSYVRNRTRLAGRESGACTSGRACSKACAAPCRPRRSKSCGSREWMHPRGPARTEGECLSLSKTRCRTPGKPAAAERDAIRLAFSHSRWRPRFLLLNSIELRSAGALVPTAHQSPWLIRQTGRSPFHPPAQRGPQRSLPA